MTQGPSKEAPQRDRAWRLRDEFHVTLVSADDVLFYTGLWSGPRFSLRDTNRMGFLARLVAALDGSSTLSELVRATGAEDASVQHFIDLLRSNGLVQEAEPVGVARAAPDTSAAGRAAFVIERDWRTPADLAFPRLRDADVLLLGGGDLATAILKALCAWGIGTIRSDVASDGHLEDTDLIHIRADQRDALAGADVSTFAVCATDRPNPGLATRLNAVALERTLPWLPVTFDGGEWLIGPGIIPGQTPCYVCFTLRAEANVRDHTSYRLIADDLARIQEGKSSSLRSPSEVAAATAFAAQEVVRAIAAGVSMSTGRLVRLHPSTLTLDLHDVLRLPRCPACGRAAGRLPAQPEFYTLEKLIESMDI